MSIFNSTVLRPLLDSQFVVAVIQHYTQETRIRSSLSRSQQG